MKQTNMNPSQIDAIIGALESHPGIPVYDFSKLAQMLANADISFRGAFKVLPKKNYIKQIDGSLYAFKPQTLIRNSRANDAYNVGEENKHTSKYFFGEFNGETDLDRQIRNILFKNNFAFSLSAILCKISIDARIVDYETGQPKKLVEPRLKLAIPDSEQYQDIISAWETTNSNPLIITSPGYIN